VEVDELYGLGLCQGTLRVHQEVEERVDALQLIVRDGADGLLAMARVARVVRQVN